MLIKVIQGNGRSLQEELNDFLASGVEVTHVAQSSGCERTSKAIVTIALAYRKTKACGRIRAKVYEYEKADLGELDVLFMCQSEIIDTLYWTSRSVLTIIYREK